MTYRQDTDFIFGEILEIYICPQMQRFHDLSQIVNFIFGEKLGTYICVQMEIFHIWREIGNLYLSTDGKVP